MIFDKEEPVVLCEKCSGVLAVNPVIEGPHWSCSKCGWSEKNDFPPTGQAMPRELDLTDSAYQTRDVYAHYGAAVSTANILETGLINYLTLIQNKAKKNGTQSSWDHYYAENTELTMGKLVQRIQQRTLLTSELKQELATALKMRNDLAHYYFRERALHTATFAGRAFMIEELKEATETFSRISEHLTEEILKMVGFPR